MSKNKKIKLETTNTPQDNNSFSAEENADLNNKISVTFLDKLTQGFIPYIIIFILSFVLYGNTIQHQFALDDDIIISKNEYVLEGVKGIPAIFKKDMFASFYNQMNTVEQLSGGRYRPLSIASFALEQQFIGTLNFPDSVNNIEEDDARRIARNGYLKTFMDTHWDKNKNGKGEANEDLNEDGVYNEKDTKMEGTMLRHFNNVLFYAIAIAIIFYFLSTIVFNKNKWIAFIISLLFLAHPIHTEVVANMKSRDEIFSIIFMMLTLLMAHKYELQQRVKYILFTCISFLLAMLSKEYGATLIFIVPISLYLFSKYEKVETRKYLFLIGSMIVTFFVYAYMRSWAGPLFQKSDIQETEILNSPYAYAEGSEGLATKLYVLYKYFMLQIFPHPLCSDYGFNSIPYKHFTDVTVWLGIIITIAMAVFLIYSLLKKKWIAFALAFYLFNLSLVSNFVLNVGATMGERLVFHSSLGFCMLLGYGMYKFSEKIKKPILSFVVLSPIIFLYSFKTIDRNKAWKNDTSLHLTDVEIMPNSTSLNGNAASRYLDLSELPKNKSKQNEYIQKSLQYGKKAIELHPEFVNGLMNYGLAYAKLEQFDSAKKYWDKAFAIYPHHPNKPIFYGLLANVYYQKGYAHGGKQEWQAGIPNIEKALEMDPTNARYWYDLGGFAFNAKDYAKAKMAWTKAYQLNPNDPQIQSVQGVLK